jgi:hypothetical protein
MDYKLSSFRIVKSLKDGVAHLRGILDRITGECVLASNNFGLKLKTNLYMTFVLYGNRYGLFLMIDRIIYMFTYIYIYFWLLSNMLVSSY